MVASTGGFSYIYYMDNININRKRDGNKVRIEVLVDKQINTLLRGMYEQHQVEMGKTSWNSFIQTLLIKSMQDESIKALMERFLKRVWKNDTQES